MAKVRLFVECPVLEKGSLVALDKKQSHYLAHVMRHDRGDSLKIFNGCDGLWQAHIHKDSLKKSYVLEVDELLLPQKVVPEVHLCFAPLKQGPLHFLIEKGTELGVTHFHPLLTERTVVRAFKEEKHRLTALEACEQCERLQVPELVPLEPLDTFLSKLNARKEVLYVCDERREKVEILSKQYNKALIPYLLIGPEGGFSPQEFAKLQRHKAVRFITLSPYILRAETAAIAALSQLGLVCEG